MVEHSFLGRRKERVRWTLLPDNRKTGLRRKWLSSQNNPSYLEHRLKRVPRIPGRGVRQSISNVCHRHRKVGMAFIMRPIFASLALNSQGVFSLVHVNRLLGVEVEVGTQRTALRWKQAYVGTHLHPPHPRH